MKNEQGVTVNLEDMASLMSAKSFDPILVAERDGADDASTKQFLASLGHAFLKFWWLIAAATIVFGAAMYIYLHLTSVPTYTATITMHARVSQTSTDQVNISDFVYADSYTEMYRVYPTLATPQRMFLAELQARHSEYAALTAEDFARMIGSGVREGTPMFYITVTDTDPVRAVRIATVIRETYPEAIRQVVNLDEPVTPVDWPINPSDVSLVSEHRVLKTLIAALIGCMLACLFAYIKGCVLDDGIESIDWLRETFKDVPVLAEIPDLSNPSGRGSYAYETKKE